MPTFIVTNPLRFRAPFSALTTKAGAIFAPKNEREGLYVAMDGIDNDRRDIYFGNARPGQIDAIRTILDRLYLRTPQTSIIAPPGYGKSDIMRCCAIASWAQDIAACSLIICANDYLRGQMVHAKDVQKTVERFRLGKMSQRPLRYRALDVTGKRYHANGECFLSTTIQLIQNNVDNFVDWIRAVKQETGREVVVYVDEVHTHSTMNEWGATIKALQAAGALIVVLTATAMREDGHEIVGFRSVPHTSEPVSFTVWKRGHTENTVIRQLYSGTDTYYVLEADYEYSFRQAWDENSLCKFSDHFIDVDLTYVYPDDRVMKDKRLSELKESAARKELGHIVRHPHVINLGCTLLVEWLEHVRRMGNGTFKDCAAIVFCANDIGDGVNAHAEQIKATLTKIAPHLDVRIATSADAGTNGASGKKVLDSFVLDGQGDILIVKQMAGLGLDAPRLKVCLDLSPVRAAASYVQRTNRITRPYKGLFFAHLITLADVLAQTLFDELIRRQGGAKSTKVELVDEQELPKGEEDTDPMVFVKRAARGDVRDTEARIAPSIHLDAVLREIEKWPELLHFKTIPQIYQTLRDFESGEQQAKEEAPANTGDICGDLRKDINRNVDTLAKARFFRQEGHPYTKEKQSVFARIIQRVWSEVYQHAAQPFGTELKRIQDIAVLTKIKESAEALCANELSG